MSSKRNILLVENDHRERASICKMLEEWGYLVTTAFDGKEALQKIESGLFPFVIVDFEMPGFSGISFIRQARAENENVSVLFLATHVRVEDAVQAMKEGAFDFAHKPVDPEQLKLFTESVFAQEKNECGKVAAPQAGAGKTSQIITRNRAMQGLLNLVERVAKSSASVLVQGESGTGKELFSRFIHDSSARKGPFVAVNCAALPESLLESELFGHEKGAFTGAITKKAGKFEMAHGGTILLDEITEMQLHLQSKLLRVIQEREVDRVGGTCSISVDVRIIATTNRDVKKQVETRAFREDLYYRLSTIPVIIPSLRERRDDIPLLVNHFIKKYNVLDGRSVKGLTKSALASLVSLEFNGNVRELENIIQRAVLLSDGTTIREEDLFLEKSLGEDSNLLTLTSPELSESPVVTGETLPPPLAFEPGPLKEMEEKMIFRTLDKTEGNRTRAAQILGISVRTLRNKLNEYKEKI